MNRVPFRADLVCIDSLIRPLLNLTNAYSTLANSGRFSEVTLKAWASSQKHELRAGIDLRATFIVTSILADPPARARTISTDSVLATRRWSAVKTGTSEDMREKWAEGYSQRGPVRL